MNYQPIYDVNFYIEKFLRHLKRRNYSPETTTGYMKDLKNFNKFIYEEYSGAITMEQIQKEDLLDFLTFLQEKGLKPNTVFRHLSTLKSFYKFLVFDMNFKIDVASRIRHSKVYTPLPAILTFEEVDRLLEKAKEYSFYYFVFYSLLYFTGSRIKPILHLEKENIDLVKGQIYLPYVKGGRDHYLPIAEDIKQILTTFLKNHPSPESKFVFSSPKYPEQPINASVFRIALKKIAVLAGIEKRVTPHILRHCTATHLTLRGADQKFIATVLAHSDLRSTARYQQLNVEDLRSTIDLLGRPKDNAN